MVRRPGRLFCAKGGSRAGESVVASEAAVARHGGESAGRAVPPEQSGLQPPPRAPVRRKPYTLRLQGARVGRSGQATHLQRRRGVMIGPRGGPSGTVCRCDAGGGTIRAEWACRGSAALKVRRAVPEQQGPASIMREPA